MISELQTVQPELYAEFGASKRRAEGESQYLRSSRNFELSAHGDINTYAVFAEASRILLAPLGRAGIIVPTGIATDSTTQHFFRDITEESSLASLFDFENAVPIFPDVHRSFKFSLVTLAGRRVRIAATSFVFFAHDVADLQNPKKRLELTPGQILTLNPNTGTCPIFRTARDASITLDVYQRFNIINRANDANGNPWGISFMAMFHMANDSAEFKSFDDLTVEGWTLSGGKFINDQTEMLPLYEAKLLHQYDHRWATYTPDGSTRDVSQAEKVDPNYTVRPRYWITSELVQDRLASRAQAHGWLLGYRKICRATDERTLVCYAHPPAGVGHSGSVIFVSSQSRWHFYAYMTSFALDYVTRQKLGGTNLSAFVVEQLPIPHPRQLALHDRFITPRVLELTYTAHDMAPFARDLGDHGGPFRWDEERRFIMRCELDALFFHLYGIARDDVDYIMETFPIVKRKDEAAHGCYRTKDMILGLYDRMAAEGLALDKPLADPDGFSALTPPPGQGPRHPLPVQGS